MLDSSPDKPISRIYQPEEVRVWFDAFKVLHITVEGKEFVDVRAVRAFPISGKADYISFIDLLGKEMALVAHPDRLDVVSLKAVTTALDEMYYVPKILRVDEIIETWGISHWRAQTDRGYASFEVVDRDYIRKLPHGRYVIQDADGNRFEIEDVSRLDERSRTLVYSET